MAVGSPNQLCVRKECKGIHFEISWAPAIGDIDGIVIANLNAPGIFRRC